MKDKLITRIDPHGRFSDAERAALLAILREVTYEKNHCLLKPGKIAEHIYYVVKGGLRSYFIKDGTEITDYFFFEEAFAADYPSLYSGQPAKFYLETTEATQLVVYGRKAFSALAQRHFIFERLARVHAEQAFLEIEERMRMLQHEPLAEKYAYTLRKFPHLFQRVPQHQIASYLGVKPESLSRIKRSSGERK